MSYDITTFKVKKMENLCLSLDLLSKIPDVTMILLDIPTLKLRFEIGDMYVEGTMDSDREYLEVTAINLAGSGSGWLFVENILSSSKGFLQALLIWEGGDEVEYVNWQDGIKTLINI